MKPEFVTKPAFTVAGKRIHTKPMSPEIPNLWQQFGPQMDAVPHPAEPDVSYGLMAYDLESGELDYMAGRAVEKVADLPAGMTAWEVPANTYAVFETTLSTLTETFDYIQNTWWSTSGYQPVADPFFERYGETFDPNDPTSKLSIYIPVEKKGS